MKNLILLIPLVPLLSFSFACQKQGNEAAAKTKTEFIIFFMAVRGVMAVQFSMIADKKLLETGMAPL